MLKSIHPYYCVFADSNDTNIMHVGVRTSFSKAAVEFLKITQWSHEPGGFCQLC